MGEGEAALHVQSTPLLRLWGRRGEQRVNTLGIEMGSVGVRWGVRWGVSSGVCGSVKHRSHGAVSGATLAFSESLYVPSRSVLSASCGVHAVCMRCACGVWTHLPAVTRRGHEKVLAFPSVLP